VSPNRTILKLCLTHKSKELLACRSREMQLRAGVQSYLAYYSPEILRAEFIFETIEVYSHRAVIPVCIREQR